MHAYLLPTEYSHLEREGGAVQMVLIGEGNGLLLLVGSEYGVRSTYLGKAPSGARNPYSMTHACHHLIFHLLVRA